MSNDKPRGRGLSLSNNSTVKPEQKSRFVGLGLHLVDAIVLLHMQLNCVFAIVMSVNVSKENHKMHAVANFLSGCL